MKLFPSKKIYLAGRYIPVIVGVMLLGLFFLFNGPLMGFQEGKGNNRTLNVDLVAEDMAGSDAPSSQAAVDEQTGPKGQEVTTSLTQVFVEIKGAVQRPGVYPVPVGSRLFEVIHLAGGLTEEADSKYINQAAVVEDQASYYVYSLAETREFEISSITSLLAAEGNGPTSMEGKQVDLVDINQADQSQLETLPGIGPAKAQAIIGYRDSQGPFKTIDQLKEVDGIGDKTFEKLADLVKVGP